MERSWLFIEIILAQTASTLWIFFLQFTSVPPDAGFYSDSAEEAFPSGPRSARSSEKTPFWGHRSPGATPLRCYIISTGRGGGKQRSEADRRQRQLKHWASKHGEDHLPASVGAEARKRQRASGQDHNPPASCEFAHFCILSLFPLLWHSSLSLVIGFTLMHRLQ